MSEYGHKYCSHIESRAKICRNRQSYTHLHWHTLAFLNGLDYITQREMCWPIISACAALFTQWLTNAISGLTRGCKTRPAVVLAVDHDTHAHTVHHLTTQSFVLCYTPVSVLTVVSVPVCHTFIVSSTIQLHTFCLSFSLFVHPPLFSIRLSTQRAVFSPWSLAVT